MLDASNIRLDAAMSDRDFATEPASGDTESDADASGDDAQSDTPSIDDSSSEDSDYVPEVRK